MSPFEGVDLAEFVKRRERNAADSRREAADYNEKARKASRAKDYWDDLLRKPISERDLYMYEVERHTHEAEWAERDVEALRLAEQAGLRIEILHPGGTNKTAYGVHAPFALFEPGGKKFWDGASDHLSADKVIEICNARVNKPRQKP